MLIEFSVGNFLSFKSVTTFSMVAANIKEYHDSNVFTAGKHELLKSAAIYGANASGKSNLIKAMMKMEEIIILSSKRNSSDELEIAPFLFSTETVSEPSLFEITINLNSILYRYGFEATNTSIKTEWLYETKKNKEQLLFIRENNTIEITQSFREGKGLEEKTRDNTLFLNVVEQFNGAVAKSIFMWFFHSFITINALDHKIYQNGTFLYTEDESKRKLINNIFLRFHLGFDDFSMSTPTKKNINQLNQVEFLLELSSIRQGKSELVIKTRHKKYDAQKNHIDSVLLNMLTQESQGTYKIFNLTGILLDGLFVGGVIIIDELDASLHPLLTLEIIKLFNSKETNPKNAQLIFATHDTNILSYGKLRRDQIYFVEKDEYGASDLYSLAEFVEEDGGKVRNDRSYEKDYIQGRYGAIPFIGDFSTLIK